MKVSSNFGAAQQNGQISDFVTHGLTIASSTVGHILFPKTPSPLDFRIPETPDFPDTSHYYFPVSCPVSTSSSKLRVAQGLVLGLLLFSVHTSPLVIIACGLMY